MSILVLFKLLGSLALLMFGMKAMSEALQKMAGPQLRHVLGAMTTNRFTGMLRERNLDVMGVEGVVDALEHVADDV